MSMAFSLYIKSIVRPKGISLIIHIGFTAHNQSKDAGRFKVPFQVLQQANFPNLRLIWKVDPVHDLLLTY